MRTEDPGGGNHGAAIALVLTLCESDNSAARLTSHERKRVSIRIEQRLKLRNPIYSETAAYGHMGRKPEIVTKIFSSPEGKTVKKNVELFTWEKLDYVPKVKKAFGIK